MDPSKIDWWDSFYGFIGGIIVTVTGMIGWFNKKVHATHIRIRALEEEAQECAVHRAEQSQQHLENLRRLSRIEEGVDVLLERRATPRQR